MASLDRDRQKGGHPVRALESRAGTGSCLDGVATEVEGIIAQGSSKPSRPIMGRTPKTRRSEPVSAERAAWMAAVGQRLRAAREAEGMTQLQVSQAALETQGINQGYVSLVEAGQVNLTAEMMVRLARSVGLTLAELICPPFQL